MVDYSTGYGRPICTVAVVGTANNDEVIEARALRLMNHVVDLVVQLGGNIDDAGKYPWLVS